MGLQLTYVYKPEEREEIRALFKEYTDMILKNEPSFQAYLDIQHYDDEIACLDHKYGLPAGRLYLAWWDGASAGCVGLRKMDADRCELKRLYVRPEFRRRRVGRELLRQVIGDARSIGYRHMLLDTLPFMAGALRLYKQFGFYEIPCYNDSPLANTIFLQLDL